jgi:predicted  nucleic acid-binding Zn-ribbon protein
MKEFPFHTFLNLVTFDRTIAELENTIERSEKKLEQIQQQQQAHMQAHEQLKAVEHAAKKSVDMKELDVKSLDVRIAKIKYNLDNVANPKEYASLSKELAKAQQEQQDLEVALLQAWHALEGAQRELQRSQHAYDEQQAKINADIASVEQEIAACDQQMAQLLEQRSTKQSGIPEEWLQKYEMMRNRIADPVVPIEGKSCSGCAYILSEQDLVRLAHRALLQCKHCFRFLYDPAVLHSGDAA